ncbi:hypothetical protein mRhiFer1_009298 [Rhinolophus ferrumequinum]|uniref:Uncharacterized protein n=1 Tax=Rhinolophus ferrumequinum TaxID=59479 RepID=A0A7J7RXR2_RHIFE|nr:hypothetical protein mRhiFer1_009298 [Rhinolophus ferrumequinum]
MFSLNPRSLQAVSDLGCVWGQGPWRNGCSVASRPLLFAKTPVLFSGRTVLLLKLPRPHAYWNPWWLFSHSLQCQTRITTSNGHFGSQWSLTCSQLLRGVPSFLQFPPFAFHLRQGCVCNGGMGESRTRSFCWSQVFCAILCSPLPTHSHTHRAWAPGTTQACLRPGPLVPGRLEHVCCLSH